MTSNFLSLISTLFGTACLLDQRHNLPNDYSIRLTNGDIFDIIIVGAGAAGCVLANRLSQNRKNRVLLVEAGSYPPSGTEVPGLFFTHMKSKIDWSYDNERSPNFCQGYVNETCTTASGKVLGGSTSINGMIYTRALRETYASWAKMGNYGWDYESLEKYYEHFEGSIAEADDYEKKGDLTLTPTRTRYDKIRGILVDSTQELGLTWRTGNEKFGVVECYSTIRNNRRCGAPKAYLSPLKLRRNLFITLNTLATKILFDKKKAIGVRVRLGNRYINIMAKDQVVVSAGSIASPKLLMLSGIGPKLHLESLGIPLIADLPVGQNYHDHFLIPGIFATIFNSNQNISYKKSALEYCVAKDGLLAATNVYNIQWFLNTKNFTNQSDMAIQFYYIRKDESGVMANFLQNLVSFKNPTINSVKEAAANADVLQFGCIITEPLSRGEILLRSTDPDDKPKIFGQYLSDDRDVEVFLQTIKRLDGLLKTPTMRKYKANLFKLDIPNCKEYKFGTSSYWKCFIKNLGSPCYHPVGTCKMAPAGDPTGVVAPDLKVFGLENIRVVDASIMPTIVDRNLMSTVYVIAHKGADLILSDLNNK